MIDGADELEVTLNDNRKFAAKLVGTDPTTDIALLKIDAKDLPTIPFGDSEKLKVGEWVLAVGNPFNLTSTVTAGIVSAKGRGISMGGGDKSKIESFIQTDAAVNPGNSGGALVIRKVSWSVLILLFIPKQETLQVIRLQCLSVLQGKWQTT